MSLQVESEVMDLCFGFDTPVLAIRQGRRTAPCIPPGGAMSNGLAAISYGLGDISYVLCAMDIRLWAMGHGL